MQDTRLIRHHGQTEDSRLYTKHDLENWTEVPCPPDHAQQECTSDDTTQIAFGYGLFTGGFGLHYGMEKVGAMVVPLSSAQY